MYKNGSECDIKEKYGNLFRSMYYKCDAELWKNYFDYFDVERFYFLEQDYVDKYEKLFGILSECMDAYWEQVFEIIVKNNSLSIMFDLMKFCIIQKRNVLNDDIKNLNSIILLVEEERIIETIKGEFEMKNEKVVNMKECKNWFSEMYSHCYEDFWTNIQNYFNKDLDFFEFNNKDSLFGCLRNYYGVYREKGSLENLDFDEVDGDYEIFDYVNQHGTLTELLKYTHKCFSCTMSYQQKVFKSYNLSDIINFLELEEKKKPKGEEYTEEDLENNLFENMPPLVLFYGTLKANLDFIITDCLSKMNRNCVTLYESKEAAIKVAERHLKSANDEAVILKVLVGRMILDGKKDFKIMNYGHGNVWEYYGDIESHYLAFGIV